MKANTPRNQAIRRAVLAALLLPAFALPATAAATRPFSAQKPADPTGTVEVIDVEGSIEIVGWDQPTVDVTGTIGAKVERVDVASSGNRTTVRVVLPRGNNGGGDDDEYEAHLKIRVPQKSQLEVSLVSADLRMAGVSGAAHLQTVSGEINGDGGGDLEVASVSGDIHLSAHGSHSGRFKSVSGDVVISGVDGDVQLSTVSGDARLMLGTLSRAQLSSVSGDVSVNSSGLAASGQLSADSVSGDVGVQLGAVPDADIDVQAFSGEIHNCFGPKAVEEQYGPGSRLNFRSGKGDGRIQIDSKSGDVTLCAGK